eukprot:15050574-Alexandrium_andersonii.AAC.1
MEARFLCKVEARLGGGGSDLKEARLPNRVIRWAPGGYLYEADPWRADQLTRGLPSALKGARAVTFPGYKRGRADFAAAAALPTPEAG